MRALTVCRIEAEASKHGLREFNLQVDRRGYLEVKP
jgi:hypothetical protein